MGFVWRWLLVRLRQTTTTTKLQSTMSHCTHPLSFLFAPLALLCTLFFRQFTKLSYQKCSHFLLSASLAWASALSQCLPLDPLGGRQRHARRLWFCCAAPHGVVFFECIPLCWWCVPPVAATFCPLLQSVESSKGRRSLLGCHHPHQQSFACLATKVTQAPPHSLFH